MILPELYLDNSVVLNTEVMKFRPFATGVEGLFTGKTVTGFLSLGDNVDDGPITGLTWNFTENGVTADYYTELLGSAITTYGAAYVAGQTPLYVHTVSSSDVHLIGGPVVVKAVRPLVGFPTNLAWENDFFFRFNLTRKSATTGVESPWSGAALQVFLATTNGQGATAVHASLDLGVGTGITEVAAGEFVGGFEGADITAQLAANQPIYAIARVGQAFRAAAQLTVVKKRAA